MMPAATPIMTAPVGATYPQAGVITTNPATAPEQNPSTLGFPRRRYSIIAHVNEATAVASVVVVNAFAAMPSAPSALPAKSIAVIFALGFHTPFIQPSIPQTMWAIGK